jgi:hypothetical protein
MGAWSQLYIKSQNKNKIKMYKTKTKKTTQTKIYAKVKKIKSNILRKNTQYLFIKKKHNKNIQSLY